MTLTYALAFILTFSRIRASLTHDHARTHIYTNTYTAGRHPAVYAATLLGAVFQAGGALAVGPYSLFTLRFVAGVCLGGADLVGLVFCLELSSTGQRATSGMIMQIFFAGGLCLTAAISVVFPSWRQMYLAGAVPALMFVVTRWWMPESPKWLAAQLRQGKIKCRDKVLTLHLVTLFRRTHSRVLHSL